MTSWAKEDDLPAPGTLHSQPHAAILQAWTKVGGCAVCVLIWAPWADCTTFQWLSLECSAHSFHQWLPEMIYHSRADGRYIFKYFKQ
jgi:hypothetical protein